MNAHFFRSNSHRKFALNVLKSQQLLRHTDQTPVTTTFSEKSHALYFWESAHTSTYYPKSLLKVRLLYKPILSTSRKSSAYKVDTNQNINLKAHFFV